MTERQEKLLVAAGLVILLPVLFAIVGTWALRHGVPTPPWLLTPLDRWEALLPASVWVYASWYPVTALPLVLDRDRFRRAYRAYVGAFAVCLIGYVSLPVTIARPSLAGLDGSAIGALQTLYAIDPPVNLFPSFHAAVAVIVLRIVPTHLVSRVLVGGWALALLVACVLTRQHYALDVVAGAGVGWLAVGFAHRYTRPAIGNHERTTRCASLAWTPPVLEEVGTGEVATANSRGQQVARSTPT